MLRRRIDLNHCRSVENTHRCHLNQKGLDLLGLVRREPVYCPDDGRHEGGVNLAWASVWNVGTSDFDEKGEKKTKWQNHEEESTEAK